MQSPTVPTTDPPRRSPSQPITDSVKRLLPYKADLAEAFARAGHAQIAGSLRNCSTTESLVGCSHCGKSWWIVTKCRLRVCPICSKSEALDRAALIKAVTHSMQHPKMLTLTMPVWTRNPRDGIRFLRASFTKLRRTKLGRSIRGGAYQIELKPKPEGWHIHLHAIIDAPFLPYQRIFSEWSRIVGVDVPQVDIRAAESARAKRYICKYVSKTGDIDASPESIVDWYLATKGQRLWACFGQWYHADLAQFGITPSAKSGPSICPHCGAEKTIFYARDGPYVFGMDVWKLIQNLIAPQGVLMRDRPA